MEGGVEHRSASKRAPPPRPPRVINSEGEGTHSKVPRGKGAPFRRSNSYGKLQTAVIDTVCRLPRQKKVGEKGKNEEELNQGGLKRSNTLSPKPAQIGTTKGGREIEEMKPDPGSLVERRDHLAWEVYSTEVTYVKNLRVLVESFINPMMIEYASYGVSKEDLNVVFSNIKQILTLNEVLLGDLAEVMKEWSSATNIGKVLLALIPYLKQYVVYARNRDRSIDTLNRLETVKPFMTMMKTWEVATKKNPDTYGCSNLDAFLILPIQRIPRYELLLRDLVAATPESHSDYEHLQKAYHEVVQVNRIVDDDITLNNQRRRIFSIQLKFVKGTFSPEAEADLVQPHRVFIKEGPLLMIAEKKRGTRHFWLFNDLLVFGQKSTTSLGKYSFGGSMTLDTVRVEDYSGYTESVGAIAILSPMYSFIILAASLQEKEDWFSILSGTVREYKENLNTLKKGSEPTILEQAPLWIPDEVMTRCMQCNVSFTTIRRRHHCRKCGQVICGSCSPRKLALAGISDKPVRVCNSCYSFLEG